MEETTDRELEAILMLIKLTQNGSLKWSAAVAWGDLIECETTKYSDIYYCDYSGKRLRIYKEKQYVEKQNELNRLASLAIFNATQAYPYWKEKMVLEITNQQGQSLWRFPYKPALGDLFSAVKYHVAGVKEVIDSLLSDSTETK